MIAEIGESQPRAQSPTTLRVSKTSNLAVKPTEVSEIFLLLKLPRSLEDKQQCAQ